MFSKGIFKSNWKRFWIIPFIVTIVLFIGITFQMIIKTEEIKEEENIYINDYIVPETKSEDVLTMTNMVNSIEPMYIGTEETDVVRINSNYERSFIRILYNSLNIAVIFILPIILSILLLGYMNEEKSSSFIHGLPISKKRLYITNIITGIIMYVVPYVVNAIIILLLNLGDMGDYLQSIEIFKWLGICILYNTIFFSFSSFIGMFCASKISHGILTYVLMYAPIGLLAFGAKILEEIIYGFNAFSTQIEKLAQNIPFIKVMENFSDMMYYYSNTQLDLEIKTIVIYIVISILMLFIGYFIYKRRKLEITKEFIAFRGVQSFIKYAATLCVNLLAYMYFYSIFDEHEILSVIGSLIITVIAYFIIEMILKKTYKVFKSIKGLVIYVITIIVLYSIAINGALGFETKIPQIDDIKEVAIIKSEEKITFDEQENIENILNLHQKIVNMRGKGYSEYIIEYTLKNGSKINRKYLISTNTYKKELQTIFNSDEYVEESTKSIRDISNIGNIEINVTYKNLNNRYSREQINVEDKQKFMILLLQDIKERKANVQINTGITLVNEKNEYSGTILDLSVEIELKDGTYKIIKYTNKENINILEYIY